MANTTMIKAAKTLNQRRWLLFRGGVSVVVVVVAAAAVAATATTCSSNRRRMWSEVRSCPLNTGQATIVKIDGSSSVAIVLPAVFVGKMWNAPGGPLSPSTTVGPSTPLSSSSSFLSKGVDDVDGGELVDQST